MVNTYNVRNEQLSPHFNVSEFRCKCGAEHSTLISDDLVRMLESLYTELRCSKIIISSGYRCVNHDKAVGGSGTGQHTLGKAADICCYDLSGNPINSKLVCCAAADLGFSGVARINDNYTHVDVRTGHWFGDETKGNSYCIPCKDFYEYFGIVKETKPTFGIDISLYQDKIDWSKLDVDFVIIKAGQKDYTDPLYEQHYAAAEKAGLPIGAYWFGEAKNVAEAQKEADCFIQRLKGKQFAYPVYYDVEEGMLNTDAKTLTAIVKAFLERVERAGYWVGLYMSGCPMHDMIDSSVLKRYALWVADTRGVQPSTYLGVAYGMWQYSHTGNIAGVTGNVDLDYCYTNYPSQIAAKGLNGYGKPIEKPPEPAADDGTPVEIVIDGQKYTGKLNKT